MKVYVLVINDRHVDTEVRVFLERDHAIGAGHVEAEERGWEIQDTQTVFSPLPPEWLFAAQHPTESDHLQVVAVELDTAGKEVSVSWPVP